MLLVKVVMGRKTYHMGPAGAIFRKNNQLERVVREALSEKMVFGLSPEG